MACEKNLKALLIIAELKDWLKSMPSDEAIVQFRQMIQKLKSLSAERDQQEKLYMTQVFHECAHLNLQAKRAIEK